METESITHSSSDGSVVTETRTSMHAQTQSTKIQSSSNIELFWPRKFLPKISVRKRWRMETVSAWGTQKGER
jgi:hypothetical protein